MRAFRIVIRHPRTGLKRINVFVGKVSAIADSVLAQVAPEVWRILDVPVKLILPTQGRGPINDLARATEAILAPVDRFGIVMIGHCDRSRPEKIGERVQAISDFFPK